MIKNSKGGITSRCNCQCFFMLLRAFCKNAGPLLFGNDLRCNTISFSRTIPPKQMSVIFDSVFYGLIIDDFYLQKKGTLGDFSVQIALSEEHKIAVEQPFFRIAGLKSEKDCIVQSGQCSRMLWHIFLFIHRLSIGTRGDTHQPFKCASEGM